MWYYRENSKAGRVALVLWAVGWFGRLWMVWAGGSVDRVKGLVDK